jgi:hypothetical protein
MKLSCELPSFLRLCGVAALSDTADAARRWLQARIGGDGLVLKAVEYPPMHSVFQNGARLANPGFRCVSQRLS